MYECKQKIKDAAVIAAMVTLAHVNFVLLLSVFGN
jgi:hypothetical protein